MAVERLEASAPAWDHATDLPGPGRLGAAVAAFKGKIYVLGGYVLLAKSGVYYYSC